MPGTNSLPSLSAISLPSSPVVDSLIDTNGNVVQNHEYIASNDLLSLKASTDSLISAASTIDGNTQEITRSLEDLFNYVQTDTSVLYPKNYPGSYLPTGDSQTTSYTLSSGTYIDADKIPFVQIGRILDDATFVKMRIEERNFLTSIIGTSSQESLSKVKIQVGSNQILNQKISLVAGNGINISQIPSSTSDGAAQIRFDSIVPYEYYHLGKYNVIPTRPDTANPYRYRVNSGPYVKGSLRVYVNYHRIPSTMLDETFSSVGDFHFKSSIDPTEIPDLAKGDTILCDYDVPVNTSSTYTASSTPTTYETTTFQNNAFSLGEWVGFTSSGWVSSDLAGTLVKINSKGSLVAGSDGSCLNPVGIVVGFDGSQVVVAVSGLVPIDFVPTLTSNRGKKYVISKTVLGYAVPSDDSDVPTSGYYSVPVGTAVVQNNIDYLWINMEKPTLIS